MRELKKIRMQDITPLQDREMKAVLGGSGVVITPGPCRVYCTASTGENGNGPWTGASCYNWEGLCEEHYGSRDGRCTCD